jgi:hypothetical protein
MNTFAEQMAELRRKTGSREGRLRGTVTVDQRYAHYQHEHLEFAHPRGGRAQYLSGPLFESFRDYLADYGRDVLHDGGQRAMVRSMEDLSGQVESEAPREFGDLRLSGHPEVRQGVRTVYDRPPRQHRLTDSELAEKSRIKYMTLPARLKGWIWWHVSGHTEPPPRRHLGGGLAP